MQIAIPLFDRFTALDAIGPYEVLSRLPGASVTFVAAEPGAVRTDNGMLALTADKAYADVPSPDVLVIPGGIGTRDLLEDAPTLDWIRSVHETSEWTTSVCTGSLLLGAAGVLAGLEATTHWAAMHYLERFGAQPVSRRVVEQGKVITAAGVSSGIDMALGLAAKIAGDDVAQVIQLYIEYDPQPPFDAGSLESAPEHVVEIARSVALS
jgi:putative intracellular protease/amidase